MYSSTFLCLFCREFVSCDFARENLRESLAHAQPLTAVYIVFHINDLRSLKWGVIFHKVLSWSHATLLIQRKVASFQYFFFISFFKIFDDILLSWFFFRVWRLRNPSIFHHFFDQSVTSNEIKQCWQYSLKYFCSKGWSISFARCFLHSMKNGLPIDDRRSILFIDNYPTMRQRCLISV